MPDDADFKIHIISDADNSGFKSAGDAAADLGKDTEKTSDKFEGFHTNARALHSALHLIAHESGPAMGAAVSGAAALMTGGLFTAMFAVRELFNWIGALKKKAEDFRESQAAMWLAVQEGASNAATAAQEFNDKLDDENTKAESVKTVFAGQKKILDTQIEAHKQILEAIEREELADAAGDKEKEAAIKRRFDLLKISGGLEGERQKIELEQKQLGETALDKFGADLAAKGFEKVKEHLLVEAAELKTTLDNLTKEFGSPEKIKAASDTANWLDWGGQEGYEKKKKTWADYQAISGALNANAAVQKEAERGLGKTQSAGAADATEMATLTATIAENTAELRIHRQTAAQESELKNINTIAARSAAGGKISDDEAQLLMRAANLASGHTNTLAQAVELFNANAAKHGQILEHLAASIQKQGADLDVLSARVATQATIR